MPIISNANLQTVVDKLARFAAMSVGDDSFDDSFTAGMEAASNAVLSGAGGLATFLFETETDMDVAADMLSAARDLDETHPTPPARFIFGISSISAFVTALNRHIARYSDYTTLDTYLTSLNASTPTLRVHQAFHDHLKSMSRGNVFVGSDTVLATFACTGAATGTTTLVASLPTSVAGAKIVVKNQGAVTTGATLTVTGRKLDGTTQALTATIATGTDNFETNLSSVLRLFTAVTTITIAGATNGNVYEIVALTDRDISAA
jgi:hypothetical protein